MSTRCVVSVIDDSDSFHIYRHRDGYPATEHGVLATLPQALSYAWPLPRFEASDFGAAVFAAWKKPAKRIQTLFGSGYVDQGGNIRMVNHYDDYRDVAYRYEIRRDVRDPRRLAVTCFARNEEDEWEKHGKVTYLTGKEQPSIPLEIEAKIEPAGLPLLSLQHATS